MFRKVHLLSEEKCYGQDVILCGKSIKTNKYTTLAYKTTCLHCISIFNHLYGAFIDPQEAVQMKKLYIKNQYMMWGKRLLVLLTLVGLTVYFLN
jgi:hypothetical protein